MPNLERKTQQAFINWLAAASSHNVTLGITARHAEEDDTDTKTLPALWVNASIQQELAPNVGCYQLVVETILECNLDDTSESTAATYLTAITDILQWDVLATALSGVVSAYQVKGVEQRGPCTKQIDGRITRWTYAVTLWADEADS
jgi:hypothetical protein